MTNNYVTELTGDLLDAEADVIAQQVNCSNAMGSGLALAILNKYPKVKAEFHQFSYFKLPQELLGECQLVEVAENSKWVANLFGQLNYGRLANQGVVYTDYGALNLAIQNLYSTLKRWEENTQNKYTVAFPKYLGCGLAGGDWDIVKKVITFNANFYRVQTQIIGLPKKIKKDVDIIIRDKDSREIMGKTGGYIEYNCDTQNALEEAELISQGVLEGENYPW